MNEMGRQNKGGAAVKSNSGGYSNLSPSQTKLFESTHYDLRKIYTPLYKAVVLTAHWEHIVQEKKEPYNLYRRSHMK